MGDNLLRLEDLVNNPIARSRLPLSDTSGHDSSRGFLSSLFSKMPIRHH